MNPSEEAMSAEPVDIDELERAAGFVGRNWMAQEGFAKKVVALVVECRELRQTITRLNRRCQLAESVASEHLRQAQKRQKGGHTDTGPGTGRLGRALLCYGFAKAEEANAANLSKLSELEQKYMTISDEAQEVRQAAEVVLQEYDQRSDMSVDPEVKIKWPVAIRHLRAALEGKPHSPPHVQEKRSEP